MEIGLEMRTFVLPFQNTNMSPQQATQTLIQNGHLPQLNDATQKKFLEACKKGYTEVVHAYLVLGMPTELHDEWGKETPLIRAAEGNHPQIVELLVKFGADLENRDNPGDTALQTACNWGNLEVLQKLVEMGAKVDTCNTHSETPLTGALKNDKTECLEYLLPLADPNAFAQERASFPHYCIWNSQLDELETALEAFQTAVNFNLKDKDGDTLLMYAVKRDDSYAVEKLLEWGADANVPSDSGWLPYEYASVKEKYQLAELLEDATHKSDKQSHKLNLAAAIYAGDEKSLDKFENAEIASFMDGDRRNAIGLYLSKEGNDNPDFVQRLIDKGVSLEGFDMHGYTLSALALAYNNRESAKFLLARGIHPNNPEGWCDCWYSVLNESDVQMLDALVKGGMNTQDLSHYESTFVYGMSDKKKAVAFIKALGKAGANLNIVDYLIHDTILNNLAYNLEFEKLKAFVEAGADVNLRDKNKENALQRLAGKYYCTEQKAAKIAQYLLDKGISLEGENAFGGTVFYQAQSSHNEVIKEVLANHVRGFLDKTLAQHQLASINQATEPFWKDFARTQNFTFLQEWVRWGEHEVVKGLLEQGISPNPEYDLPFDTPLKIAVSARDVEMVRLLLEHGAEVDKEGKYDSTALGYAAYCKEEEMRDSNYKILEMLLQRSRNLNRTDDWGRAAVHTAISNGDIKAAELFMNYGADLNPLPVGLGAAISAVASGSIPMLEWVLEKGANLNLIDHNRNNALHAAIDKDQTDMALILIENGIDLNLQDFEGLSPLMKAINKGNETLVKTLIEQGADTKLKDKHQQSAHDYAQYRPELQKHFQQQAGRKSDDAPLGKSLVKDKPLTPLLQAIYRRDWEETARLISAGTDLNEANYRGDTPLMVAINTGQVQLAQQLIEAGANVLLTNELGDDAFSLISMSNGFEQIKAMIESKGRKMKLGLDDLNQQAGNSMNYDALKAAIEKGDIRAVDALLVSKKCDLNVLNSWQSPLHRAVERNDLALTQLLLQRGAYAQLRNSGGQTPLEMAERVEIRELLERYR